MRLLVPLAWLAACAGAQPAPTPLPTPAPDVPPAQWLNVTLLRDPAAVCLDGTPAPFYFRPCSANWDRKDPSEDFCANITQRWIIVLDGSGGACYSAASCAAALREGAARGAPPASAFLDGILLPFAEVNPNLYKATAVYVPAGCSWDLFAGNATATTAGGAGGEGAAGGGATPLSFRGRAIVDALLDTLLHGMPALAPPARLVDADDVVVVGPAGVLARLDGIAAALAGAAAAASPPGNPALRVSGVLDGGVLPGGVRPFNVSAAGCSAPGDCPPATALAAGAPLWWGGANATAEAWMPWCPAAATPGRAHSCLLGEGLLPHLTRPGAPARVLLQQQQLDATLLRALGAWPAAAVNGTPAAAWAVGTLAPALGALLVNATAGGGGGGGAGGGAALAFSAACEQPPTLAVSPGFYHTAVRHVDVYGHTRVEPLAAAVSSLLGDPPASWGVYADDCTTAGGGGVDCNPSGCAVG